jgi:glycosyltransferase involved in cell wall biosynthesis
LKNVLIISYYWPPAAGPGVQRALKFVKYLRHFGYEPIVLTVKNNQQLGYDESLIKDIPEGLKVYSDTISLQKNNKSGTSFLDQKSLKDKILIWLRANILIPDAKIFWYWQARQTIKKIFKAYKIDLCFITAPPQTSHLLGYYVKKKYAVKVVHDFRDPWTDAFFLQEFPRTKIAIKFDQFLENKILVNADAITSVSQLILNDLQAKVVGKSLKMLAITNGYDEEIYVTVNESKEKLKRIVYTGTISQTYISPLLFNYLQNENSISLDIYGNVHSSFKTELTKYSLNERLNYYDVIDHDSILKIQTKADYLLLFIPNITNNKGILTGKLFEYLAHQKPILAFGPSDGEASEILKNANIGLMIEYNDPNGLEKIELFFSTNWLINIDYIEQFHRKNLTKKLAHFFDEILISNP